MSETCRRKRDGFVHMDLASLKHLSAEARLASLSETCEGLKKARSPSQGVR